MAAQLDQLARDQKALAARTATAAAQEADLQRARDQLARDQQALATRTSALAQRETALTEREAGVKEREETVKQRERASREVDPPTGSTAAQAIQDCDALAAYQFDQDRALGSKWQDQFARIEAASAINACQRALQVARHHPDNRRIMVQLGRAFAATGSERAQEKNIAAADMSFNKALDLWTKAAALGSGQAYYLLGVYYRGYFSAGTYDAPRSKNMQLAVDAYEASAGLQNSSGLTVSAYYSLFPHWFPELKNIVSQDDEKGRKYLDAAQRYDNPATQFVTGIALLYGQAKYDKNEAEGLKLINIAACRGNNWAIDFFKDSKKHKPVLCKP